MKEINYQFRQRFSVVHQPGRRDMDKRCPEGFVEVNSDWCITVPENADIVLMNAARDLEDYFFTSMKISLKLVLENEAEKYEKRIVYGTDALIKEHSYRFAVEENKITLIGCDSRMAAQAGYFLEDGEVLCYHLYNRNDFEDYLLNNTRFDRGSATRHEYASIYKEDGKYYIPLNLQIRFIK